VFCIRCGTALPDGAAYCPACGAAVPAPPGPRHLAETVGTPEGGPPPGAAVPAAAMAATPLAYGGFWRRLVAFVVDGMIIGAVITPFGIGIGIAGLAAGLHGEPSADAVATLFAASMMVWFLRVIVSWLYGAGFESSRWQATPGKMLLGLRVTDLEGRRITFLRATGRALGKWLSGLLLGMGYVLVAFTDRKQGLHDFLAGTLVRR